MITWANLKRAGVYLFIGGLGLWLIAEALVTDKGLAQVLFIIGWVTAIAGAVMNGIAVLRERFLSG